MRGFSLTEVLVVIAVTGVVGVALNSIIVNFYRTNAYLIQQTSAIDTANRGLRVSFQELRQAAYGDDGSYPIVAAATSTVTFFSDVDNDGSVERIRLYLSGTTFYRGVTESTSSPATYTGQTERRYTIANYVRNGTSTPIFRYYNANGVEISSSTIDVSAIAAISTKLMVDLNPYRAPDILTFEETATLRNLR